MFISAVHFHFKKENIRMLWSAKIVSAQKEPKWKQFILIPDRMTTHP